MVRLSLLLLLRSTNRPCDGMILLGEGLGKYLEMGQWNGAVILVAVGSPCVYRMA